MERKVSQLGLVMPISSQVLFGEFHQCFWYVSYQCTYPGLQLCLVAFGICRAIFFSRALIQGCSYICNNIGFYWWVWYVRLHLSACAPIWGCPRGCVVTFFLHGVFAATLLRQGQAAAERRLGDTAVLGHQAKLGIDMLLQDRKWCTRKKTKKNRRTCKLRHFKRKTSFSQTWRQRRSKRAYTMKCNFLNTNHHTSTQEWLLQTVFFYCWSFNPLRAIHTWIRRIRQIRLHKNGWFSICQVWQ